MPAATDGVAGILFKQSVMWRGRRTMQVDLNRLKGVRHPVQIDAVVSEIIQEASSDPVYLSDLLIAEKYGNYVMSPLLDELRKDPSKQYKLFVIEGKYREKIYPGDTVIRRHKKSLYIRPGIPMSVREQNTFMRLNQWEQKMERHEKFIVDNKGCISVSADDAWYFLTQFGIHGKSGAQISPHPEFSGEPMRNPKNGKMQIVRYWRFKELDSSEYDSAPKIETRKAAEKRLAADKVAKDVEVSNSETTEPRK
jgi:hypothetical protein